MPGRHKTAHNTALPPYGLAENFLVIPKRFFKFKVKINLQKAFARSPIRHGNAQTLYASQMFILKNILYLYLLVLPSCGSKSNQLKYPVSDTTVISIQPANYDSSLEFHTEQVVYKLPISEVNHYIKTSYASTSSKNLISTFIKASENPVSIFVDPNGSNDTVLTQGSDRHLKNGIQYLTIAIARTGRLKILNQKTNNYVPLIKVVDINGRYSGYTRLILPDNTVIMHMTTWVH